MAEIYSRKLISVAGFSGGPSVEYTTPADRFTVVKGIAIVFGNVTVSGIDAWVMTEDLAKLVRYTWFTTMSSFTNNGGTAQWWGGWGLNPGDTLQVQTAAGTCDITAYGYELALP